MKIFIMIILVLQSFIYAETFKIEESAKSSSKIEACESALLNAKVRAIEEYGVTLNSSFILDKEVNNNKITKYEKQKIIQKAKQKIKVISYTENIKQELDGNYICKVNALLSIGKNNSIKVVRPDKLKKYNGQYIKTCSVVAGIYFSRGRGRPIFINFGRNYPNQLFTAVIWENNRDNFSYNIRKLLNRKVCIKGEVKLYRGKPNINLKDETQIEF